MFHPSVVARLLYEREILGNITNVVMRYFPDCKTNDLASIIEKAFKDAGYKEVRSKLDVEKLIDEEIKRQKQLAQTPQQKKEDKPTLSDKEKELAILDENGELPTAQPDNQGQQDSNNKNNTVPPPGAIAGLLIAPLLLGLLGGGLSENEGPFEQEQGLTAEDRITQRELNALANTKSQEEWSKVEEAIKGARDGYYPEDWFEKVINSGLAEKVQANWK